MKELEKYAEEVKDKELLSTIKIIKEFGGKIFTIKKYALKMFESNKEIKTFLTTAHTSKGLEWDKVTIADDFGLFSKMIEESGYDTIEEFRKNIDELPVEIVDEVNLYYIAITRAKYKLEMFGDVPKELEMSDEEINKKVEKLKEEN